MNTTFLHFTLQIIEGLIAFIMYESLNPSKKRLKNFIIISVSYIVMGAINLGFDYNFLLNSVVLFSFQFFFGKVLYKQKYSISLWVALLFVALVTASEYASVSLLSVITKENLMFFTEDPYSYMILIICSKSVLFLSIKILVSIFNKTKFSKNSSILISLLISIFINSSVFVLLGTNLQLSNSFKLMLSVTGFIMLISIIVICIYQQQASNKEQELEELRIINQEIESDNKYYELLEYQNNNLMLYAHDTKKHLSAIKNLTDNDEINAYLQKLTDDLEDYSSLVTSGNHHLDVIINRYIAQSQMKKINFSYDVRLSNLKSVEMYDLVTILSNILDNAVEAAEKSQHKRIEFTTDYRNTYDVIVVKNSCDIKPVSKGGSLKTTKENKRFHGLGIKSVRNVLKKYDGDYLWEYDEENKEFITTVMILRK
ncbi:MAG: GHKL domain-containing protein [Acutalibacteraceae bacterium]|nr:GHKL domain-containing protein [Acutalibacteraceae bacterium]